MHSPPSRMRKMHTSPSFSLQCVTRLRNPTRDEGEAAGAEAVEEEEEEEEEGTA